MWERWKRRLLVISLILCAWLAWYGLGPEPVIVNEGAVLRASWLNNLPGLVEAMNYDPRERKATIKSSLSWMPTRTRNWLERGPLKDRKEQSAQAAEEALMTLGQDAASAIPQVERLTSSTNGYISGRAFNLLRYLGTNSIPWLLSMMADTNNPDWGLTLRVYRSLTHDSSTNISPEAWPLLVRCLRSERAGVIGYTATGVGNLNPPPTNCLAALIDALSNTNFECRMQVMCALGKYREGARAAVPELTRALQDPNPYVCRGASNALLNIAPAVLTNAATTPTR